MHQRRGMTTMLMTDAPAQDNDQKVTSTGRDYHGDD